MAQKPPIIKKVTLVAQSRLFAVEAMELEFSNGEERTYERLKAGKNGAVMIVPMLDEETLLLIREYAGGVERYELAFPKGLIDEGESALQAANRELQEEVGFAARCLKPLRTISLAPGYLSHQMEIVVARDLYESRLEGDEPEPLEVVPWKLSQWRDLLQQPDFTEARSIAALYLLRDFLSAESSE